MKNLVTAIFILLFTYPVLADSSILLGISTSVESKIMAENRPYMVYLPPSYEISGNTYPVIYLLDENTNFGVYSLIWGELIF